MGYAMTQRIKALLDDAVTGLEPRSHDPVAAVVRRGRAARRRAVVAGALAVALLGGGLSVLVGGGREPVTDEAADGPAGPRVVDGMVVAGAVRVPVPAGWTVETARADAPCGELTRTILIPGPRGWAGCRTAPIEVHGTGATTPGGVLLDPKSIGDPDRMRMTAPVSVTLSGGEPGWLLYDLDDKELAPGQIAGYSYHNVLLFPWSRAEVYLRTDGPAQRKIIESFRSYPTGGGPLVLPGRAGAAEMTALDAAGRNRASGHRRSTDPAVIAAVLRLLSERTTPVSDLAACTGNGRPGTRLSLTTATDDLTTVVVTVAGDCVEAVSSAGGRARLAGATMTELVRLFGIGAR
jgi:hypothetical protein